MIKLILPVLIFLLMTTPVSAQETQTSTTSSTIKAKLEELKKEIASKAAQIKQEVGQRIANKAWGGVVKEKQTDYLIISGVNGNRKVVINEYTKYSTKPKVAGSLKDVAVDDFIYALGDVDDAGNLNAKKVVKSSASTEKVPVQYWGEVKTSGNGVIRVATKSGELNISAGSSTDYQLGAAEASFADAKPQTKVIVVGTVSGNQVLGQFIYFFPRAGQTVPEKVATPGASATASAKPKATTTPKPSPTKKPS